MSPAESIQALFNDRSRLLAAAEQIAREIERNPSGLSPQFASVFCEGNQALRVGTCLSFLLLVDSLAHILPTFYNLDPGREGPYVGYLKQIEKAGFSPKDQHVCFLITNLVQRVSLIFCNLVSDPSGQIMDEADLRMTRISPLEEFRFGQLLRIGARILLATIEADARE